MNSIGSILDEAFRADFLQGFYAVAALIGTLGVVVELGAGATGAAIDWSLVAIMALGSVTAGGALWQQRSAE